MEDIFGNNGGYSAGVSFGSGIFYNAGGGTVFLLQPGIYLLQLTVDNISITATGAEAFLQVNMSVNGQPGEAFIEKSPIGPNNLAEFSMVRNRLLQITGANTTVGFRVSFNDTNNFTGHGGCGIIFTRQQ